MKTAKKLLILSLCLAATYSMATFASDAVSNPSTQLDMTPPPPEGGLSPDQTMPIIMPKEAASIPNKPAAPLAPTPVLAAPGK